MALTRPGPLCSVLHVQSATHTQPDPLLLDQLREARRLRDEHEQAFTAAVREAMRDRRGNTVREIAEAAGLGRERVYQIAADRR